MVINYIRNNQMYSITLPEKVKGQFWIKNFEESANSKDLVSIEAKENKWIIKSNKKVVILDSNNNYVESVILTDSSLFKMKFLNSEETMIVLTEATSKSSQTFKKIAVKHPIELTIGRTTENSICYSNKYVSASHAKLSFDGENWIVTDLDSRNGTFVGNHKISTKGINYGECIYILGLKIIVGDQFFAINNPYNQVTINSKVDQPLEKQTVNVENDHEEIEDKYFYRSPIFKKELNKVKITIDPPPSIQKAEEVPLTLMLGPALTMAVASVSTGYLSVLNILNRGGKFVEAMPTLIMSGSMLLGTLLWPLLTKQNEKNKKLKNEKNRQDKYLAYIESVRDEIKKACKEQTEILNQTLITSESCIDRIANVDRNLWERIIGQNDFLTLSIGRGNIPLNAEIKIPDKKFSMDDDTLLNAMYSLANEPKNLINVPISLSLIEKYIVGIIGKREDSISFMNNLLLQLVALHSYDELKVIVISDKDELSNWEFMKWTPHIWNDEKTFRYFANNLEEVKELSIALEKIIENRSEDSRKGYMEYFPYYVIVCANKDLADKCEALGKILKFEENRGLSIITLYDEMQNLPKETKCVIEVSNKECTIFDKDRVSTEKMIFTFEAINQNIIKRATETLANVQLNLANQKYALPNMITFLELFNVGKIEHLNILSRWKENNPTMTLQAPVGVDNFGEPFVLDLHEKFHGPHGLIAGMTGSGKSEFIITYILSLAINYHPNEVAFILIDYKGGGLTGAFEDSERGIKLPHLAGTITNLDGASVKRSLISIQSELRRRQAIFNFARKQSNEGTMDIYKYQKLFREKVVNEPLPHLFIISDEFAELKSQQPEFMEQLISAARIGRSLGVHLILATQKPSGVVDDQIWSNSKFKVCLKVQEKADSNEMIKRPDAAELVQTGRFYLQVGYNEFFALGQSAWCGAEYIPTEDVEKIVDSNVQLVDNIGRVIKEAKSDKKKDKNEKTKQIVSIMKYLSDLAVEENISVRPLWLEPIPALIFVDEIEEKYNYKPSQMIIDPIIGEYDDPFNQCQHVLKLDLSNDGNCIIYGSTGNGKTTFLTTLVYSMIRNHDADTLNIYILDFGAETLKSFEKAPQVGGVLTSSQSERINNLFKMLQQELDRRKNLFSDFGGDLLSYCNATGKNEPNIVVILNNYAGFIEQFEDLEDMFGLLTRDGTKYGIYFVVSAASASTIRYRIVGNFNQLLTLQLNDESDYSSIVGKTEGLIPTNYKGRGLVPIDRVYEFQTAHCSNVSDQYSYVREYCAKLVKESKVFAKPIPILPKYVNIESLELRNISFRNVPIGINKKSLTNQYVNLDNKYIYPVVAKEIYSLQYFAQGLAEVLAETSNEVIVLDESKLFIEDLNKKYRYYSDKFDEIIIDLFDEVLKRNHAYVDAGHDFSVFDNFDEKAVIIVCPNKTIEKLSEDSKDKLKAVLDNGTSYYKVKFILVESSNQFSSLKFNSWFDKHVTGKDGIWLSNGFAEQFNLTPNTTTPDLYKEVEPGFGYVLNRGKVSLLKMLTTKLQENDDYE